MEKAFTQVQALIRGRIDRSNFKKTSKKIQYSTFPPYLYLSPLFSSLLSSPLIIERFQAFRDKVAKEILQTEEVFVHNLDVLVKVIYVYVCPQ